MKQFVICLSGCALALGVVLFVQADQKPETNPKPKGLTPAENCIRVLESTVDFEFIDTPIADVLAKLSADHQTKFVLEKDPRNNNIRITARMKGVSLGHALETCLSPHGLTTVVVGDTIYVAHEFKAHYLQFQRKISVNYDKVPFDAVVRDLSKQHRVNLVLDPRIRQTKAMETPITLVVDSTPVQSVVGIVTEMAGLELKPFDRALFITARGARFDRLAFLASQLETPVPVFDKGEVALPFLLETIGALTSAPGTDRDPSRWVTILVDAESFKKVQDFDMERVTIKFNNKLINMPLDEILRIIADQIGGVVLVRKEFIEIVERSRACAELRIKCAKDTPMPRLANRLLVDVPLEDALRQMADRYNLNIMLHPEAKAKKDLPITARLINVPLDIAVETIADLADLKLVRKSNVILVTTKEHAAILNAEHEKQLRAEHERLIREKAEEEKLKSPPEEKKKT